jgi:hypothetical protein
MSECDDYIFVIERARRFFLMLCISPLKGRLLHNSIRVFIYIDNIAVGLSCPSAFLCDIVTTEQFKCFWG